MKKIILLLLIVFMGEIIAQSGNGHDPNTILSYTPSGYTVPTYMRQASSSPNAANNTISDGDRTDLFVNFTFDTSGKNVFLVYTTNGSNPSKSNGNVVSASFSNYSDPNRTWVVSIPTSANTEGTDIKYIFYISDSDLNSAWGRVAGDGYQTTWAEGNSYFSYTVNPPLPVELVSFTAFSRKSGVELSWSTAAEVNNYGFEVERAFIEPVEMNASASTSSASKWSIVGFVEGHGNSNSPKDYSFIDSKAPNGNLQYRLKQIDFDGSVSYSDVVSVNNSLAKSFKLFAPYPNPFNPSTTIKYSIPYASNVSLKIYDVIGNEVANLVNEKKDAGEYEVEFNAKNLPSGIYFSSLRSNGNVQTQKLILLK